MNLSRRHIIGIWGVMLALALAIASCVPTSPTPPPTIAQTAPPAVTQTAPPAASAVVPIPVGQGLGFRKGFWEVYFTAPTGDRNRANWRNGIDAAIAGAIGEAQRTLDIAAFEFNNETITEAVLNAHERGVRVRIVTDNDHGINDDDSTLLELQLAGIPIIDDGRSALMHNKFMVIDGIRVIMGSMNFTMNGVYRNNNNVLMLRSRQAVEAYQAEFNEMFERGEFGPRSSTGNDRRFTQEGIPIVIMFAPEDPVVDEIIGIISGAQRRIRFMAFSYTLESIGEAMLERAAAGIDIQGVFERVGSQTQFSRMTTLFCAGVDVRQDGNPAIMHHKVIIVDDTVITGSFNFSQNATRSNDENVVIITDPDLTRLYLEEFGRVRAIATPPQSVSCE